MATATAYATHTSSLWKDNDVSARQTTNFPDQTNLYPLSGFSGAYVRNEMMFFDLSAYAGNVINSCFLTLVCQTTNGYSGSNSYWAKRVSRANAVYNQATFLVYNTGNGWTNPGGDYDMTSSGTAAVPTSVTTVTMDIADLANDAILNRGGFLLFAIGVNSAQNSNFPSFYNFNAVSAPDRARLEIDYSPQQNGKMFSFFQ